MIIYLFLTDYNNCNCISVHVTGLEEVVDSEGYVCTFLLVFCFHYFEVFAGFSESSLLVVVINNKLSYSCSYVVKYFLNEENFEQLKTHFTSLQAVSLKQLKRKYLASK